MAGKQLSMCLACSCGSVTSSTEKLTVDEIVGFTSSSDLNVLELATNLYAKVFPCKLGADVYTSTDSLSIDHLPVHTPMTLSYPIDYTSNSITIWQRTYCVSK